MNEFKINNLLTVKFRYPLTEIYVNGKYFMQCKKLVLNLSRNQLKQYDSIDSIDGAAEIYDHYVRDQEILKGDGPPEVEIDEDSSLIDPREEFWGHCSNLQAWAEHDYDTRLLKADLAFPLLEKLSKVGDKRAQVRYKEEILKRLSGGTKTVVEFLFVEGYQDDLTNEELLYGLLEPREAEILMEIQRELSVIYMFVPSIDRNVGLQHPEDPSMTYEQKRSIRGFSIEDKCVKGLQLTFAEFLHVPTEIQNLKKLKQMRLKGNYSELNSDEIVKGIQKLNGLEELFLRSSLVQNLEKTSLKKIKKIGRKIYPIVGI
ncbi:MAG: hypothetical protein EAX91_12795 [Candidatus Lokiarchaeota archaeon]|nr:hypothetical protein [Candidatus Lokiarchaeota archaeon]